MNQYLLGLAGIAAIILIAVAFSSNRKAISFRVVGAAFALQAALAFLYENTVGRALSGNVRRRPNCSAMQPGYEFLFIRRPIRWPIHSRLPPFR
jgi:nucleoside permease NupC